jgi:uncharacterized membrane protein AbrB (regulator of aidB expression)
LATFLHYPLRYLLYTMYSSLILKMWVTALEFLWHIFHGTWEISMLTLIQKHNILDKKLNTKPKNKNKVTLWKLMKSPITQLALPLVIYGIWLFNYRCMVKYPDYHVEITLLALSSLLTKSKQRSNFRIKKNMACNKILCYISETPRSMSPLPYFPLMSIMNRLSLLISCLI